MVMVRLCGHVSTAVEGVERDATTLQTRHSYSRIRHQLALVDLLATLLPNPGLQEKIPRPTPIFSKIFTHPPFTPCPWTCSRNWLAPFTPEQCSYPFMMPVFNPLVPLLCNPSRVPSSSLEIRPVGKIQFSIDLQLGIEIDGPGLTAHHCCNII
jgi:hypothetical protein